MVIKFHKYIHKTRSVRKNVRKTRVGDEMKEERKELEALLAQHESNLTGFGKKRIEDLIRKFENIKNFADNA
jgi:uncharacterized protein YycO